MQEVELSLYYGLNPSVVLCKFLKNNKYLVKILAWEEESNKRHISDWELFGIEANTTYFRYRSYNRTRPVDPYDLMQTW